MTEYGKHNVVTRYFKTKFASHRWTPKGSEEWTKTSMQCPVCAAKSEHIVTDNTPDYGGDGERLWIEHTCSKCLTQWDDCYEVTRRVTYPASPEVTEIHTMCGTIVKKEDV